MYTYDDSGFNLFDYNYLADWGENLCLLLLILEGFVLSQTCEGFVGAITVSVSSVTVLYLKDTMSLESPIISSSYNLQLPLLHRAMSYLQVITAGKGKVRFLQWAVTGYIHFTELKVKLWQHCIFTVIHLCKWWHTTIKAISTVIIHISIYKN